MTQAL